ncbi:hypothetical protein HD554DRAFT_2169570 [Boletus coccyginus]|nr:hypothetical protein HD554DRAFT_2169570 [Boletus coccyginus]
MLALVFACCGLRHRPLPVSPSLPRLPRSRPPSQMNAPRSSPRTTPQREYPLLSPAPAHLPQPTAPRGRPPTAQGPPRLRRPLKRRVRPPLSFPCPAPTPSRKMVNVNAQFPFNLHNHDNASSHSSRNVSGGTLPSSRAASPSPARAVHKSASSTSFRPDPDDVLHYLPLVVNHSAPILNVRLVNPARSTHSARGRPQRSADPNTRSPAPDEEHTPRAPSAVDHLPVNPGTPPCPEDFNIFDAGAVARSWGD